MTDKNFTQRVKESNNVVGIRLWIVIIGCILLVGSTVTSITLGLTIRPINKKIETLAADNEKHKVDIAVMKSDYKHIKETLNDIKTEVSKINSKLPNK